MLATSMMAKEYEQQMDQINKLCERLNEVSTSRDEAMRLAVKYAEETVEELEGIRGLIGLEPNSNLLTYKERLSEELEELEARVDKSREVKAKLEADKKAKNQVSTNLKHEFDTIQNENQLLESKIRSENLNTPLVLQLMKSHKPGPKTKSAATDNSNSNDDKKNNLA